MRSAPGPGARYALQLPPNPTVIRPPSTMRGTRRDPPDSSRNRLIAAASCFTSKYSTFTFRAPKSSRAAFVYGQVDFP